jgi:hypothetical protein
LPAERTEIRIRRISDDEREIDVTLCREHAI